MKEAYIEIKRQGKLRLIQRSNKDRAIQRRHWGRWRLINFGPFGPYSWGPRGGYVWTEEKVYNNKSYFDIMRDRWDEAMEFTAWGIL